MRLSGHLGHDFLRRLLLPFDLGGRDLYTAVSAMRADNGGPLRCIDRHILPPGHLDCLRLGGRSPIKPPRFLEYHRQVRSPGLGGPYRLRHARAHLSLAHSFLRDPHRYSLKGINFSRISP